jgi:predicted aspartyl protease
MQLKQETKSQPQKTEKFVNAISESARNWIFVELNNKRKKILVDTGAARTVMNMAM